MSECVGERERKRERKRRSLQKVMPMVGLRFSLMQVMPAVMSTQSIDYTCLEALGCTIMREGGLEVTRPRLPEATSEATEAT